MKDEGFNEETGEVARGRGDEETDPWLESLQHEVVRSPPFPHFPCPLQMSTWQQISQAL